MKKKKTYRPHATTKHEPLQPGAGWAEHSATLFQAARIFCDQSSESPQPSPRTNIDILRSTIRQTKTTMSFHIHTRAILPEHLYCLPMPPKKTPVFPITGRPSRPRFRAKYPEKNIVRRAGAASVNEGFGSAGFGNTPFATK